MRKSPVLLLLLDAFRWDYLDPVDTPFLWRLAQENLHVRRIVPGAGFCERSEILTGAPATKTLNFSAIGYEPERAAYRELRSWIKWIDRFVPIAGQGLARRVLWRVAGGRNIRLPLYRIPFDLVPNLRLTEDYESPLAGRAFSVESVLDLLHAEGRSISWHFTALGFPNGGDEDRISGIAAEIAEDCSFYLGYVHQSDRDGHRFGPETEEMRTSLRSLDARLGRALRGFLRKRPDLTVVLLGDHGMTWVHRRVDVGGTIRRLARRTGMRVGRDLFWFLDSTMARMWFASDGLRDEFSDLVVESDLNRAGRLIDLDVAGRYEIPVPSRLYGDLVWWANPGVLIEPDFFHGGGEPVRGMHGYDPEHSASQGCAVIVTPDRRRGVIDRGRLRDLCPTLCELLGLRSPEDSVGRSLLGFGEKETEAYA